MTSSKATELKIDCLFCGSRELKYKYQLKLFWELNKLGVISPSIWFWQFLKTLIHQVTHKQALSPQYTHITIYKNTYIVHHIHDSGIYIASGPPRVRLLNKITSLTLPVFFYYIFMTVGVVVTGPGLVYIHTYIIL